MPNNFQSKKPPKYLQIAEEIQKLLNYCKVCYVDGGAFKETYRVEDQSGRFFALKIFNPAKCDPLRTDREIEAMKKCASPYICKLFHYKHIKSSDGVDYFFTIEEFLDGGTLTNEIVNGKLEIKRVKEIGKILMEAIEILKSNNLVHRDIKPDNIMFRKGSRDPILIDFGLVRDLSLPSATQSWLIQGPGSPFFSSPEQLNNDKEIIGWRTDQFCLGLVLGFCVTGKHPFCQGDLLPIQIISRVREREECAEWFKSDMQLSGLNFLVKMLEPWPNRRFQTMAELKNEFI